MAKQRRLSQQGDASGPDDCLSDLNLLKISTDLGENWQKVGYYLEMTQPDIEKAKESNPSGIDLQGQALLIKWRKRTRGDQDKKAILSIALKEAGFSEIAEKYLENCPSFPGEEESKKAAVKKILEDIKINYKEHKAKLNPFPWENNSYNLSAGKGYYPLHLMKKDKNKESREESQEIPTLEPHHLFEEDCFSNRMLIEGEPGSGKTSFCVMVAVDWSLGKEYLPFDGVFLINARDITKEDDLKTYFARSLPIKPITNKELLSLFSYIKDNQEKFLFIIDGLDEIFSSLPEEWFQLIIGDYFARTVVLVTSRNNQWQCKLTSNSVDSQMLHTQTFNTEIVNLGFEEKTAFEFINSTKQDTNRTGSLEQFIRSRDYLLDLINCPLMCIFLCTIWNEKKETNYLANGENFRRTDIYANLTECLVKRFCINSKQEEYKLTKENKFPPKVLEKLKQIYIIAYNSLVEGRAQVSIENIRDYVGLIDENDEMFKFSILNKVEGVGGLLNRCSKETKEVFKFLHGSVQEELASEHYFCMPIKDMAKSAETIVRYFPHVAIFISGLVYHRNLDHKLVIPIFDELFKKIVNRNAIDHPNYTSLLCVYESNYQKELTSILAKGITDMVWIKSENLEVFLALLKCLENNSYEPNSGEVSIVNINSESHIPIKFSHLYSILKKQIITMKFRKFEFKDDDKSDKALNVNTTLRQLNLHECKLSDSAWKEMTKLLKNNVSIQLEELDLSICEITENGSKTLAKALKTNKTLIHLSLGWCKLTESGCKSLATALETNTTLEHLNLNWCNFSGTGWESIAGALKAPNIALKQLNLSGCRLSNDVWRVLAEALSSNTSLKQLDLSLHELSDRGIKVLSGVSEKNKALIKLCLHKFNVTSDRGWNDLVAVVNTNQSLTQLDFWNCEIIYSGWKALANLLKVNDTLKSMYISWFKLSDTNWKKLSIALSTDITPKQLDLWKWRDLRGILEANRGRLQVENSEFEILKDGWGDFTKALMDNKGLANFGLSEIRFTGSTWKHLLEALEANETLKELCLHKCCFELSDTEWNFLKSTLDNNRSLRKLDFSWCIINDEGWKFLEGALKSNKSLIQLYLGGCKISEEGWESLKEIFKKNTSLKILDLSGCEVSDGGWKKLIGAMKKNTRLEKLDLTDCNYSLTDKSFKVLAKVYKTNTTLIQINLTGCNISDNGWETLKEEAKGEENVFRALKKLDLVDYTFSKRLEVIIKDIEGK